MFLDNEMKLIWVELIIIGYYNFDLNSISENLGYENSRKHSISILDTEVNYKNG